MPYRQLLNYIKSCALRQHRQSFEINLQFIFDRPNIIPVFIRKTRDTREHMDAVMLLATEAHDHCTGPGGCIGPGSIEPGGYRGP